jgi:hypothetical protein
VNLPGNLKLDPRMSDADIDHLILAYHEYIGIIVIVYAQSI